MVWCYMTKDGRREETNKFAAFSGYTYNDEICFVVIEPKSIGLSSSQKYYWAFRCIYYIHGHTS